MLHIPGNSGDIVLPTSVWIGQLLRSMTQIVLVHAFCENTNREYSSNGLRNQIHKSGVITELIIPNFETPFETSFQYNKQLIYQCMFLIHVQWINADVKIYNFNYVLVLLLNEHKLGWHINRLPASTSLISENFKTRFENNLKYF